jgi:hypothetical protein
MRIILDEMLPPQINLILTDHQVFRVQGLHWDGVKNGELLKRANSEFDVFITADKNLPYQQNLKQFMLAIIVLPSNRVEVI